MKTHTNQCAKNSFVIVKEVGIKGFIKTKKVGVVAAGHSSVIANMAGLRLPLERI